MASDDIFTITLVVSTVWFKRGFAATCCSAFTVIQQSAFAFGDDAPVVNTFVDRVLGARHDLSLSRGLDLFNILRSWQSHDTLLTVVLLCLHASLRDDAISIA